MVTQTIVFSATPPTTGETPTTFNANAIACWVDLKDNIVPDLNTAFWQMNTLETNVNAKEVSAVAASAAAVAAANFQGTWSGQLTSIGQSWLYNNGVADIVYGVLVAGTASPITTPSNWFALTTAQAIQNTPAGGISATTVQAAINELDTEKAPKVAPIISGGATIGGMLNLDVGITFEGTAVDAFQTVLSVAEPTADNILTLPNKTGTIAVTSDIPPSTPSGIRQTVQSGSVDTNGFANFVSIGTGLNVNIDGTIPVIIHAAGGAISNDRLGTISTDKTLLLPASSTSYIYESVGTDGVCTSGSTTLAPIYQFGGTPAVTNGQFTFNIGEMKGYLGNGTTAPQVWLTFTGQATTDTTTVTSVINYALNGVYISGFFNVAANVVYSKNHNLGIQNFIVNIDYKFATTGGTIYAVGDICDMKWSQLAANTSITSRQKTKTSYSVKTYNNTFVGQEDGAGATISKTDGAYNFIIIRGW